MRATKQTDFGVDFQTVVDLKSRRRDAMTEFTYLFRGRDTTLSPEKLQKHVEKWVAWFKELNANGKMKDSGHPLEHTGKVVRGEQKVVHDGPYAQSKEIVG